MRAQMEDERDLWVIKASLPHCLFKELMRDLGSRTTGTFGIICSWTLCQSGSSSESLRFMAGRRAETSKSGTE